MHKELRQSLNWLERVMGIEPTQPAWKASVLPLNYTRIVCSAFATIEPGAHNSMLKNYSKSVFACQLIFVTIFLNLHFILIAVLDVFRSISIILARKFCKNAPFALHIAFSYDIILNTLRRFGGAIPTKIRPP